jgi:hypothetical protein
MNFTLADILATGWAFVLFGFFLIPPGYAIGWMLDLVSFRKQDAGTRFLLSLPFSIAMMPIVVYLVGRRSFDWPVWSIYGVLFAVFLGVLRLRGLQIPRFVWIVSLCWIAISTLTLVDLQLGDKLYYPVVAYDLNFRSAVTAAFARAHTLPVSNPFFSNGTPQPFRYHYFWFMICAMPVRLSQALFGYTGLTPRHAVIASSAWAGLGLFSTTALFGRFFFEWEAGVRGRYTITAILLFALSGLDIIPILIWAAVDGLLPTVDWWNADQVTGWLDTMLWVPHAVAALVACLAGLLVLWNRPRVRRREVLAAGLAFASGVGLSVYVSLTFALFATAWTITLAFRREWPRVASWASAGAFAALLSLPFLFELAGGPGSQGSFLTLAVRHFQPAMQLMSSLGMLHSAFTRNLANLVSLPLNYFVELGFFAVAGWVLVRRKPTTPAESAARVMLLTTLGFCSVVRSNTIAMNDLGARGMLLAQFVLLLWGAIWLSAPARKSWLVKTTLAIGLATSLFELCLLRTYPPLADRDIVTGNMAIDPDDDLGLRDFSARQVYRTLNRILPVSAVVQHNPTNGQDLMAGLYANRQFAIGDLETAVTFTGDSAGPEKVFLPLKDLFAGDANDAEFVCRQLGIDVLVVKDVDPAWNNPDSWVWHMKVLAKADRAIAVACR